jgi:hypothetical protein
MLSVGKEHGAMSRLKKLHDLMEAITFAEAGETEIASRIASEVFPAPEHPSQRILAVSGRSGFSREMIESSVGMAERMTYGLIALSVPPATPKLLALLGGRIRDESAGLPAEAFRSRAAERGIPFVHAVRRGDPEKAVAEVTRKFRRIAFLLVEPDLPPKTRFAAVSVPIFYLADA